MKMNIIDLIIYGLGLLFVMLNSLLALIFGLVLLSVPEFKKKGLWIIAASIILTIIHLPLANLTSPIIPYILGLIIAGHIHFNIK